MLSFHNAHHSYHFKTLPHAPPPPPPSLHIQICYNQAEEGNSPIHDADAEEKESEVAINTEVGIVNIDYSNTKVYCGLVKQ